MTDVVIPGKNGCALAEHVKTIHSETKVLYVSGYPDETVARHCLLEPDMMFLQKPVPLKTLAHKLRELLS